MNEKGQSKVRLRLKALIVEADRDLHRFGTLSLPKAEQQQHQQQHKV